MAGRGGSDGRGRGIRSRRRVFLPSLILTPLFLIVAPYPMDCYEVLRCTSISMSMGWLICFADLAQTCLLIAAFPELRMIGDMAGGCHGDAKVTDMQEKRVEERRWTQGVKGHEEGSVRGMEREMEGRTGGMG